MTEQERDLQDPRVLHRAAEHLTDRWAGVFFPELVERCVAECHADPARQARIPTYLAPMALHGAADRLRTLAREDGRGRSVRLVLFVDDDDTDDLYPKPVTDDVVAGADWVITFGTLDGIPVPGGAIHQDRDVVDALEADPAAVAAVIDELEDRVQDLHERIRTHPSAP